MSSLSRSSLSSKSIGTDKYIISRDHARIVCKPGKVAIDMHTGCKKSRNACCGCGPGGEMVGAKAQIVARKASSSSLSTRAAAPKVVETVVEKKMVIETLKVEDSKSHRSASTSHDVLDEIAEEIIEEVITEVIVEGSHSSSHKARRSSSTSKKVEPHHKSRSSSSLKERKFSHSSSDHAVVVAQQAPRKSSSSLKKKKFSHSSSDNAVVVAQQAPRKSSSSLKKKVKSLSSDSAVVVAQQAPRKSSSSLKKKVKSLSASSSSHKKVVVETVTTTVTKTVLKNKSNSSHSNERMSISDHALKVAVHKPSHSVRSSSSRSNLQVAHSSSSADIQARSSPHVPQTVKKSKGCLACCSPNDAKPSAVTKLVRKVTETNIGNSRSSESHQPFAKSSSEAILVEDAVVVHTEHTTVEKIDRSNSRSTCPKAAKKHSKKHRANNGFDGPLVVADSPRIVLTRNMCGKKKNKSSLSVSKDKSVSSSNESVRETEVEIEDREVAVTKITKKTTTAVDVNGDGVADVVTVNATKTIAIDVDGDGIADVFVVGGPSTAVVHPEGKRSRSKSSSSI